MYLNFSCALYFFFCVAWISLTILLPALIIIQKTTKFPKECLKILMTKKCIIYYESDSE